MGTAIACVSKLDCALLTLANEIRNRHRAHLRELRFDVVLDEVVIRGVSTSYYGKSLALSELHKCGLRVTANLIEVEGAASEPVTGTIQVGG